LELNQKEFGGARYVYSYIETFKKMTNCLDILSSSPQAYFAGKNLLYRLASPLSIMQFLGVTNKIHTHYTYGSITSFLDDSIKQEGLIIRYIKLFGLIKKYSSLSLFQSVSNESEYLLFSPWNVDIEKIRQTGYLLVQSEVPILNSLQIFLLIVKGKCRFTSTFQCLHVVLVGEIEKLILEYNIKRLGTAPLMIGLDFLENPVFQACDKLGVISFCRQQRAFNKIENEYRFGYYHEYLYWDKDSMLLHASLNHVENSLVDSAHSKLNVHTNSKKIIAFPMGYSKFKQANGPIGNLWMQDEFSKFLSCLTSYGYHIVIKPKDLDERGLWEERGFDIVTSSRGGYMDLLRDGYICAVSAACSSPGLEISIKTNLPSFYYTNDLLPSEYIGYEDMQISSPDELFKKLGVSL